MQQLLRQWLLAPRLHSQRLNHPRLKRWLGLGLVIGGMMMPAAPALAQNGNLSDVTGNIITTSDIAGGLFQSADGDGELQFSDAGVASLVAAEFLQLIQQLEAGQLLLPSTGVTGVDFKAVEQSFTNEFTDYFGLPTQAPMSLIQVQTNLKRIEELTGSKSAIIYTVVSPDPIAPNLANPFNPSQNIGNSAADANGFRRAQQNIAGLKVLVDLSNEERQAIFAAAASNGPGDGPGDGPEGDRLAIMASTGLFENQLSQLIATIQQLQTLLTQAGVAPEAVPQVVTEIAEVIDSGEISAAQLQAALTAYNRLVNNADLGFLQRPPAEFQVFQTILGNLVTTLQVEAELGATKSLGRPTMVQAQTAPRPRLRLKLRAMLNGSLSCK